LATIFEIINIKETALGEKYHIVTRFKN
jgi:hypothetical protein